jgi:hypothetical protein
MAETPQRLDVRACSSAYVVLGVIFGFIFVFGIWQATVPGGDWRLTLLAGAAFFLAMLWVGTIRIQFSDGKLSYRTLFSGTRSVLLGGIESAETKVIGTSKGAYRLLLIYLRPEKAQKPMAINIKLFSKEDVGRIFDVLGPKFKSSRRIGIYTDESA